MRRRDGTVSLFHRLPHGGHVDMNLSTDGRVLLLVNSGADVSEVICELDAVRDELTRFHTALVRDQRTTTADLTGPQGAAA
jgi:hypothetical protein